MSADELTIASHDLLLNIHTITGWTLPQGEFLDALETNFEKKLSENYSNLNVEEILYAFRNKEIDIKDWGKALNFSLIDDVIIPYLEKRFELSKLEEQEHNKKLIMVEDKKEMEPMEMLDWIAEWKRRDDINISLIPLSFYGFLTSTDTIKVSTEEKFDYMNRAAHVIKTELHNEIPLCKTTNALKELAKFEKMEKEGFTGEFKIRIINKAQRLIVYDYLIKK